MPSETRTDVELHKALSHPTRVRILAALGRGVASPKELADRIEVPLHQVIHHIARLCDLGFVELVEERPYRGTIKHFYRRTRRAWLGKEEWAGLSADERKAITGATLQDVWEDVAAATARDKFDARTDRHLTRSELLLDEDAWLQLALELDAFLERAHAIAADAMQRAAQEGDGEALIRARLILMHFEAGD